MELWRGVSGANIYVVEMGGAEEVMRREKSSERSGGHCGVRAPSQFPAPHFISRYGPHTRDLPDLCTGKCLFRVEKAVSLFDSIVPTTFLKKVLLGNRSYSDILVLQIICTLTTN